jgi:hypothetical protein
MPSGKTAQQEYGVREQRICSQPLARVGRQNGPPRPPPPPRHTHTHSHGVNTVQHTGHRSWGGQRCSSRERQQTGAAGGGARATETCSSVPGARGGRQQAAHRTRERPRTGEAGGGGRGEGAAAASRTLHHTCTGGSGSRAGAAPASSAGTSGSGGRPKVVALNGGRLATIKATGLSGGKRGETRGGEAVVETSGSALRQGGGTRAQCGCQAPGTG